MPPQTIEEALAEVDRLENLLERTTKSPIEEKLTILEYKITGLSLNASEMDQLFDILQTFKKEIDKVIFYHHPSSDPLSRDYVFHITLNPNWTQNLELWALVKDWKYIPHP